MTTMVKDLLSTPGEILKEEFLEPSGISQYRLAKAIGKPESSISEIVNGKRKIGTEMAFLFSRALGTTPDFWLKLQTEYDIKTFNTRSLPDIALLG